MKRDYLEAGQIVNTHGVQGEVKLQPWADEPAFLLAFKTLYLADGTPLKVLSARVHKNCVLARLEGVDDVNAAMRLKGRTVYIARQDARLEPGAFFLADVMGLPVKDQAGKLIGTVTEILTPPAHNVYVVTGEDGESHMIPAVPEFVKKVDVDGGEMIVSLIEGM